MHLRTSSPIELPFSTVRLDTAKTRGYVPRQGMLAMVFMPEKSAGVDFKDGVPEDAKKITAWPDHIKHYI